MSTGLYSHTTRATGIILTAAIYNSDHQNHITNQNPTMTGALSDSLSEHQSVQDPGDLGTEVLGANLADELKQLRFAIKRITGKAQWYIPPATDLQSVGGTIQTLTVAKTVVLQGDLTPPQITSNQNNYAPTGHVDTFRFRLNTDASRDITGLLGGVSGRVVVIENVGSFDMVLRSENAASTAGNRFLLPGDLTIRSKQAFALHYDNTLSRWVPFNSAYPSSPTFDGLITMAGNVVSAGYNEVTGIATPAAPATGKLRAYAKDMGSGVAKLAFIDKDGLEIVVGTNKAATIQRFTASGTWTKPAGLLYVRVHANGGGGSGNVGGNGTSSSFGAHCSASGGVAASGSAGTGSGGDVNLTGQTGDNSFSGYGGGAPGPFGGSVQFSGSGLNYGGGAGAGVGNQGGSAGGYSMKYIPAASLGATETVTVGAAGVSGGSSGAPGLVVVEEFYG